MKKKQTEFVKWMGPLLDALRELMIYSWPGNIRELQLFMQIIMSRIATAKRHIESTDLPLTFSFLEDVVPGKRFAAVIPLKEQVENYEYKLLKFLYDKKEGDRDAIASFLSAEPEEIEDKLVRYNIAVA